MVTKIMQIEEKISCILCGSTQNKVSFPYSIKFSESEFFYKRCSSCKCVFVNPIPSDDDFEKIYQNDNYHEEHYVEVDLSEYEASVGLLSKYISNDDAKVLDYGCGYGHFLKALQKNKFQAEGLEFDQAACIKAENFSGCKVYPTNQLINLEKNSFNVLHLGDVLEHLPNPQQTLKKLIGILNTNGIIFIEGPLEINPSPVYWAAKLFGFIKKIFLQKENYGKPTHLIRVDANIQKEFILKINSRIECLHWEVYETGWPYINNGIIKNSIAKIAIYLGGRKFFSKVMGNRFRGIFKLKES